MRRLLLAAAFLWAGTATARAAAVIDWVGGGGCDNKWQTAACWTPAQVPVAADTVTVTIAANILTDPAAGTIQFSSMTLGKFDGSAVVSLTISTTITAANGKLTIYKNSGLTFNNKSTS
ncbi:MAG: hypothetical protein AAB262_11105, partial [Elusimicrobiota bacterium]